MRGGPKSPESLLLLGIVSSVYGFYLVKRGWQGDTLMPGTTFYYLPKWMFYTAGVLLQIPVVAAYLFLKSYGYLG